MWLSLIFKNLKSFVHTKPVLFLFIIISQVVCVTASLAVAGMVNAVTPVPQDDRGYSALSFYIDFEDHPNSSAESVRCVSIFDLKEKKFLYIGEDNEAAARIRKEHQNHISECGYIARTSDTKQNLYKDMKKKIYSVLQTCSRELSYWEIGGGIEEDNTGTVGYLAVSADDEWMEKYRPYLYGERNKIQIARNKYYESKYQALAVGEDIKIYNTEYTVSKIVEKQIEPLDISTVIELNAKAVDDEFTVHWIAFTLKNETDQSGIAKVSAAITKNFGDMSPKIDEPQPPPLMEKQFNNMVYVLAFIIMVVVLLNISRLYSYIMSARVKALAVYSLCGSSKIKSFIVYISEIILLMLMSFFLGAVLFHFVLIAPVSQVFPSFSEFFTFNIYLKIFGMYIVSGLIIMALSLIPFVTRSITSLTKGGK